MSFEITKLLHIGEDDDCNDCIDRPFDTYPIKNIPVHSKLDSFKNASGSCEDSCGNVAE